ncbi:thiamine phosphate synthase [Oceanicella actignis]|uniref:thiamine phosphate synthase n=1 Tax=Oceanicella actignis TaxID=1189325 RepID=UPI0011E67DE0|nr:thiamine phosphate synthase [Oceanicella actignis]TYO89478.1 thiamine-phosphate pyrophosphorylase [Oceanicella actignis]
MTLPARFYPIFDHPEWFARMLPLGVRMAQLRVKGAGTRTLRAMIAEARDLCARHGALLVVNDHWRLALDEGCAAVHLGQEDLDGADLGAIRAAGLRLGLSTHDEAELARALAARPDHVALGPIHATTLKPMKHRPQGLARLRRWRALCGPLPLVAIGGMTPARGAAALAAGADCVAVVTDVTMARDPEARVREWLAALEDVPRAAADPAPPGALERRTT